MESEKVPWYKQKTTWAATAAIIATAGSVATGDIGLWPGIIAGLLAVSQIFQRFAVEKTK